MAAASPETVMCIGEISLESRAPGFPHLYLDTFRQRHDTGFVNFMKLKDA
jgi:hypothetical protein